MPSISKRIAKNYFVISVCLIAIMVAVVVFINEDLENTLVQLDFLEERDFVLARFPQGGEIHWETPSLKAYKVIDDHISAIPEVFQSLEHGFSGEVTYDDRTYLAQVSLIDGQRFIIAKDITRYEEREALFVSVIAVAGFGILIVSLLLSMYASRRIVTPLRRLTREIRNTPIGRQIPKLSLNYEDSELQAIAETFNGFLAEMESFVKREQSLVNMASHELRTPIAVIAGALDVIEQRNNLTAENIATFRRIRHSTNEMNDNVTALLALSRRSNQIELRQIDMPALIEIVLDDLSNDFDVYKRIDLKITNKITIESDQTLVKMLLRNLIQNALKHTNGNVVVNLNEEMICIEDEGKNLTESQIWILINEKSLVQSDVQCAVSGLGLFIASSICERLGWDIGIKQKVPTGNIISLQFASGV